MDRSDLELVMAVRERGSLAGAAAALGVVPSVVTKRLAALEARLGQRLFERTTRRLVLTPEGEAVCTHGRALLDGFAALEDELRERQLELSGHLRLASTLGFGRRWLGPALGEFQRLHPALRVDLRLSETLPELGAEGFDGAVWLWSVQPRHAADWVARRLARNRRVLVAAPTYARTRGLPQSPAELAAHACLVVREGDNLPPSPAGDAFWPLRHDKDGGTTRVRVAGPLSSNSGELVRDWCLDGYGIMLRSLWDVAPLLASGALVRVLPAWAMADADIQWIAPWRPRTPKRVKLLVEFLARRFQDEPWKAAAGPSRVKRRAAGP